mmetsp:Transcript_117900/g.338103  ORF Transcript_117900/g.338103 Transcript_117900/m.338103 type:complete len:227 (+) Transcript_117900:589-1269(+)
MRFLQCASLHSKPSLTMVSLCSIICPIASSVGLPKKAPICFWWETRKCSNRQLGFAWIANASSRTACESNQFDSRFTSRSVVFSLSDSASMAASGFWKLAFDRDSDSKTVFVFMAAQSFGAIRFSMWPGGISILLKSNSTKVSSLSQARCTIQIIQLPYALVLIGAGSMCKCSTSVTCSTRSAKSWSMDKDCSGGRLPQLTVSGSDSSFSGSTCNRNSVVTVAVMR